MRYRCKQLTDTRRLLFFGNEDVRRVTTSSRRCYIWSEDARSISSFPFFFMLCIDFHWWRQKSPEHFNIFIVLQFSPRHTYPLRLHKTQDKTIFVKNVVLKIQTYLDLEWILVAKISFCFVFDFINNFYLILNNRLKECLIIYNIIYIII